MTMLAYIPEVTQVSEESGIPAWMFFGWGDVEANGGKLGLVDRSYFPEGEMSFFQFSPAERRQLNIDEHRLLTDAVYSLQKGAELVNLYGQKVTALGISRDSDFFYWMVKLVHGIGEAGVEEILKDMRATGLEPTSPSDMADYFCNGECPAPARKGDDSPYPVNDADRRVKDAIKARTGTVHYPAHWIHNASEVEARGKLLAATAGLASPFVEALTNPTIRPFVVVTGIGLLAWILLRRKTPRALSNPRRRLRRKTMRSRAA